jgi:hypothetical protein
MFESVPHAFDRIFLQGMMGCRFTQQKQATEMGGLQRTLLILSLFLYQFNRLDFAPWFTCKMYIPDTNLVPNLLFGFDGIYVFIFNA